MERYETDSQRQCSEGLLKAMSYYFDAESIAICLETINSLLQ